MRPDSLFHQFVQDAQGPNEAGWAYHHINIDECLEQGLLGQVNMRMRAQGFPEWQSEEVYKKFLFGGMTPEAIRQEYYHIPSYDVIRVFRENVLVRQQLAGMERLPGQKAGLSYVGIDVGRTHDKTVISVLEKIGDKLYTRSMETLTGAEFSTIFDRLAETVNRWCPEKIVVDASTIGLQLSEDCLRRWGEARVVPVTIGGLSKEKVICHTQSLLESDRLYLPKDDSIRKQFLAISKKDFEGMCRYVLPRGAQGHCDAAMSIMLAAWGVSPDPCGLMASRLQKQEKRGAVRNMSRDPYQRPDDEDR
jgi:phage FluMu gp28-like protein